MLGQIAGCSLLWFLHKAFAAFYYRPTSAEEVRGVWVPKGPFTREMFYPAGRLASLLLRKRGVTQWN